jgi:2'-5' RNA ligase superfamily
MVDRAPLVVTVALDPEVQRRLDVLRRTYFPPARNVLAAHVTAFHTLPGEHGDDVVADLRGSAPPEPCPVSVAGVRFLGRGVAFDLRAPTVERIRADLADRWRPWLTPQDAQRWRPHVTVQNKVAPEVARAVHAQLTATFVPYDTVAVGWSLFRYRGGPWEHVLSVPFGR